jgi:hypothetical protein
VLVYEWDHSAHMPNCTGPEWRIKLIHLEVTSGIDGSVVLFQGIQLFENRTLSLTLEEAVSLQSKLTACIEEMEKINKADDGSGLSLVPGL